MPPGEFAVGKFTSPQAINDKLPCGNCDFAFRAKSPGGILCRPYPEGNLKTTLPRGEAKGAAAPLQRINCHTNLN